MKKAIIGIVVAVVLVVGVIVGKNLLFKDTPDNQTNAPENENVAQQTEPKQPEKPSGLQFEDDKQNEEDTDKDAGESIGEILDNSDELNNTDEEITDPTDDETEQNTEDEVTVSTRFEDVPKAMWCYTAINTMTKGGLVNGYGNGKFGPGDTITVGQFSQILARAKGYETGVGETGWWAELGTASCLEKKLIKNRGPVTQETYDVEITREEAVAALQLASKREDIEKNKFGPDDIPDFNEIDEEYKKDILGAYNSGITSGVDETRKFLPKKTLTRAEVCQLFYNIGWTEAGVGADPVKE